MASNGLDIGTRRGLTNEISSKLYLAGTRLSEIHDLWGDGHYTGNDLIKAMESVDRMLDEAKANAVLLGERGNAWREDDATK